MSYFDVQKYVIFGLALLVVYLSVQVYWSLCTSIGPNVPRKFLTLTRLWTVKHILRAFTRRETLSTFQYERVSDLARLVVSVVFCDALLVATLVAFFQLFNQNIQTPISDLLIFVPIVFNVVLCWILLHSARRVKLRLQNQVCLLNELTRAPRVSPRSTSALRAAQQEPPMSIEQLSTRVALLLSSPKLEDKEELSKLLKEYGETSLQSHDDIVATLKSADRESDRLWGVEKS